MKSAARCEELCRAEDAEPAANGKAIDASTRDRRCGLPRPQLQIPPPPARVRKDTRAQPARRGSQAAAAAAAASETANKITHAMSTQTASSAIAGALARDMVQGASNEVNTTSQQLREAKEAVASASTEAQKAAAEAKVQSAQAAADAARDALNAAQEATQEIQQAARAAQKAAGDVVAGISGSDLEALRQLPNDALGVWTLVGPDGKPVASGKHKGIVCNISSCGAGAAWAAEEHAKGNSYVRTNRTGGY